MIHPWQFWDLCFGVIVEFRVEIGSESGSGLGRSQVQNRGRNRVDIGSTSGQDLALTNKHPTGKFWVLILT